MNAAHPSLPIRPPDSTDRPSHAFLIIPFLSRPLQRLVSSAAMTSRSLPRATSHLLFQLTRAIGRQSAHAEFRWMQQTLSSPPPGIPSSGKNLQEMLARRVSGEPLQYILGESQYESSGHILSTTRHVHACSEMCMGPPIVIASPESLVLYLLSRINAAYVFQHCSTDLEPSSWLFEASHLRLGASMNLSATHLILYHPCLSLMHPIQSQFLSGMAQKPGACMCQMGRHCKTLPADLKFVPGPKPTHITCGTTNC